MIFFIYYDTRALVAVVNGALSSSPCLLYTML